MTCQCYIKYAATIWTITVTCFSHGVRNTLWLGGPIWQPPGLQPGQPKDGHFQSPGPPGRAQAGSCHWVLVAARGDSATGMIVTHDDPLAASLNWRLEWSLWLSDLQAQPLTGSSTVSISLSALLSFVPGPELLAYHWSISPADDTMPWCHSSDHHGWPAGPPGRAADHRRAGHGSPLRVRAVRVWGVGSVAGGCSRLGPAVVRRIL